MKKFGDNTLLLFGSKKCISCLSLEEKVLRAGVPKEEIVYLDIDIDHGVFAAFGVRIIPTLVITGKDSGEIKRIVGDQSMPDVKKFLSYK